MSEPSAAPCPWSSTSRAAARSRRRHLADLSATERSALADRAGPARLPGQAAVDPLLLAAGRRPGRDDRPAGRPSATSWSPTLLPDADDAAAHPGGRPRAPPARRCGGCFDGALVESVLMRYPDRVTMCVSSQAGCGMACPFCATGQGGLQRNMSHRRDRRAGASPAPARSPAARSPAVRAGSPTSCSWAWASRWPTTRP